MLRVTQIAARARVHGRHQHHVARILQRHGGPGDGHPPLFEGLPQNFQFERLSILPIQKENGKYFLEEYALGKLGFKDIKAFAALIGARSLFPELDDRFISDVAERWKSVV